MNVIVVLLVLSSATVLASFLLSVKGYRRTIRRFRSAIKPENPDAPGGITLDQLGVITEELWVDLDKKLITQSWALGLAALSAILAAVAGILAAL